ncbi:hypothetical protein GCM10009067_32130 [Haloarcula sebkhae]|nr:hypothetical protein GCM10009067_32130 [Haloarcula sebkhae]
MGGTLDGTTENDSTALNVTETETPTEQYVPELNIESHSPNTHKVTVQLGSFASVPTGTGTPVESGTFDLNKEFSLSPGGKISLEKHRSPDHDYDVLIAVDGTVVVSEVLYAYEGMTVKVLDSNTVDVLRSDI